MTEEEAIAILDGLTDGDQEAAHSAADDILCAMAPAAVAEAWRQAKERVGFWYS